MRVRPLVWVAHGGVWISSGLQPCRGQETLAVREVEPGRQRGGMDGQPRAPADAGARAAAQEDADCISVHVAGHDLHGVAELLGGAELDHLGAGVEDRGVAWADVVRVAALEHLLGVRLSETRASP